MAVASQGRVDLGGEVRVLRDDVALSRVLRIRLQLMPSTGPRKRCLAFKSDQKIGASHLDLSFYILTESHRLPSIMGTGKKLGQLRYGTPKKPLTLDF